MSGKRNDNIENDAIVSVETTDENVAEEQSAQEVSSQGILYDYSVKHAAALAKKEKRKGVMQFIKYALCAASAGIIQIVLFTILQAVLPKDMGNITSSWKICRSARSLRLRLHFVLRYSGISRSTANSLSKTPATFRVQ